MDQEQERQRRENLAQFEGALKGLSAGQLGELLAVARRLQAQQTASQQADRDGEMTPEERQKAIDAAVTMLQALPVEYLRLALKIVERIAGDQSENERAALVVGRRTYSLNRRFLRGER